MLEVGGRKDRELMDTQLNVVWAAALVRERYAFMPVVCIYFILPSERERNW